MAGSQDSATFSAKLDTSGMVGPAEAGAAAAEKMRKSIADDVSELGEMQRALRNLKGSGAVGSSAFKELQDRITAQKAGIAQAQQKYLELGGSFKKVVPPATQTSGALGALLERAKASGGPLSQLTGWFESLGKTVGSGLIVAGTVALAAAFVALTVAVIATTAALGSYGLAQSNAHRNELLLLEGLTKTRNFWGIAAGKATELQGALNKVAAGSALSRETLLGYEQGLYRANLRGQNLTDGLEALAIVQQTQGDAAAEMFKAQITGANMAGYSVKALANDVKARLGGIAAKQMLDLNVQTAKLRENFAVIFQDLKVEPLLKALNSITELFSQNTASGKALKTLAETLFQPLFGQVASGAPIVRRFFQGMILAALDVAIAIQKTRLSLRDTFGGATLGNIFSVQNALLAGKVAVYALVGSLLAVAAVIATVGASVYGLYKIFEVPIVGLINGFKLVRTTLEHLDFKSVGTALVMGLVGGIGAAAPAALAAVKTLGSGMLDELRHVFDSHSPSKATYRIAGDVTDGLVGGQEDGTPRAAKAANAMGRATIEGLGSGLGNARGAAAGGDSGASGRAAQGAKVEVNIAQIIVHGGAFAQEQARSFKEALIEELLGIGISLGATLEPKAA